jgi:hypothetical protein
MSCATFQRFKVKVPGISVEYEFGQTAQFDTDASSPDTKLIGYYVQCIFQMANYSGAFTDRERGLFGIHYINTTGGAPDLSWTGADYAAVESSILTGWDALASSISSDFKFIQFRWYAFGPGVRKPNPPSRVVDVTGSHVGTAAASSPHQLAMTCTLRTPLRRHWGRIYLPIGTGNLNTHGQAGSAGVDSLVSTMRGMLVGAEASQGIVPVVYDRQRGQALGVTAIEADSVPDIIRRRRPRDTGYKKVLTA